MGILVDRSLIFPMRKAEVGGEIAFPPVLPLISGPIPGLPFGTTYAEEMEKEYIAKIGNPVMRAKIRDSSVINSSERTKPRAGSEMGILVDRSLIFPMRTAEVDGEIAFPPVLPLISGPIPGLPFGTTYAEEMEKFEQS
ncbi:unnamed protein product [Strongylus vulgaris]|uniref:Uncharacterized protein n=1 Tax=Strongylus vulgaris TaxID=40348 RepID=A0A3P7JEA5_STRVU|nr:unnamed protein product [Strongylus vulgaris]